MTFINPTTRASNRLDYANRGKPLEVAIIASQGSVVILDKMPTSSRRIGPGRHDIIQIASPVDFVGEVVGSGRSIQFDAKQCNLKTLFPIGRAETLKPYQREWLIRHGGRGNAIAGLLIEATHPDLSCYYWFSWRNLHTAEASIAWSDRRMVPLGSNKSYIDFMRVLTAEMEHEKGARI